MLSREQAERVASLAFGGQPLAGDKWRNDAACGGMPVTLFFPSEAKGADAARRVCRRCSVQPDCLAYALQQKRPIAGVWGSTVPQQRTQLANGVLVRIDAA